MTLQDLTREQKLVCVALFDRITAADGGASVDEAKHVAHLADVCGEDEYQQLVKEVNEGVQSEQGLKSLISAIKDQDARDVIYGEVMDCALEDGLARGESELLDWLAKEWEIEVQIIDEPGEGMGG